MKFYQELGYSRYPLDLEHHAYEDEVRWALLDTLHNNNQIKVHAMTVADASSRNKVLAGTGLVWARI